jgi:hypothetical protein
MSSSDIRPIPLVPGMDAPEETIETVLRRLSDGPADERVTLGALLGMLDRRAYGFVLLLLAAPNLTPGPSIPGFSTIFGVPAILIALQMVLGRQQPWLPDRLARIGVRRQPLARTIQRALPLIIWFDRMLRPRLRRFARIAGGRWTGVAALVQAILLALPIPVYSMAPAAALLFMALGLIARDGFILACGHAAGLAALGLGVGLGFAAAKLLLA